jgi:hypothetical protein
MIANGHQRVKASHGVLKNQSHRLPPKLLQPFFIHPKHGLSFKPHLSFNLAGRG